MKFVLGALAGFAAAFFVSLESGPLWLLLNGPFVSITEECDPASVRCVYVREETTTGIDYVTVKVIRWTRGHATFPSFSRDGVQCEPETDFNLNWLPDRLLIETERPGDCFTTGKFATLFDVEIVVVGIRWSGPPDADLTETPVKSTTSLKRSFQTGQRLRYLPNLPR